MKEASTANSLGFGVRFGDVNNFPAVNTLGLSVNRVDIAPGGNVPLHSHPRASEANFVLKGKVFVGFVSGSNVLYSKVLKSGEMFIVPKGLVHGLVHFLKNVGTGKAVVIAAFNSQLPGAALLANTLFASNPIIPNDILAKNFQVDENIIATIKSKFSNQTK
ncbi:germin-like protein subfamily T member 2 [Papaver somniferum]|uniref:germin-like protein subfamily T member 2 n=1 Tax=Papaver somniferum TaxID=3469 RepID=UPI000E6FEFB2|nr:germin-like protein subfamily T member 2 [Papaver somniferum]